MHLSGHKSQETTLGLSPAIRESDGQIKCAAALWDGLSAAAHGAGGDRAA